MSLMDCEKSVFSLKIHGEEREINIVPPFSPRIFEEVKDCPKSMTPTTLTYFLGPLKFVTLILPER